MLYKQVRIPPEEIRNGVVLLKLKFPVTRSPRSVGLSDDQRELAMRLVRGRLRLDPYPFERLFLTRQWSLCWGDRSQWLQ